jgi:hypothetical protein
MGDQLAKLRKLTGQLQKLTYEAVKSGTWPGEQAGRSTWLSFVRLR